MLVKHRPWNDLPLSAPKKSNKKIDNLRAVNNSIVEESIRFVRGKKKVNSRFDAISVKGISPLAPILRTQPIL